MFFRLQKMNKTYCPLLLCFFNSAGMCRSPNIDRAIKGSRVFRGLSKSFKTNTCVISYVTPHPFLLSFSVDFHHNPVVELPELHIKTPWP